MEPTRPDRRKKFGARSHEHRITGLPREVETLRVAADKLAEHPEDRRGFIRGDDDRPSKNDLLEVSGLDLLQGGLDLLLPDRNRRVCLGCMIPEVYARRPGWSAHRCEQSKRWLDRIAIGNSDRDGGTRVGAFDADPRNEGLGRGVTVPHLGVARFIEERESEERPRSVARQITEGPLEILKPPRSAGFCSPCGPKSCKPYPVRTRERDRPVDERGTCPREVEWVVRGFDRGNPEPTLWREHGFELGNLGFGHKAHHERVGIVAYRVIACSIASATSDGFSIGAR